MKQILRLLAIGLISSSTATEQWKSFFKLFKKEFTKELKTINATNIVFSRGHFDISGFFTAESGQIYYFSFGDVRGMEYMHKSNIRLMYRTAEHYKDWTGGGNQWVQLETGIAQNMSLR